MNPPSAALDLLLAQAERERDAALAGLQRAEQLCRQADGQAAQLADYQRESVQRWGAQPGRVGSAASLQCVHGFMLRLAQATAQQQRQCAHHARQVAQARQGVQQAELRLAAVRKLQQRRRQAEAAAHQRRAQKQTDEAAQRTAWAARAEASAP